MTLITNAAGRHVVTEINGEPAVPYKGLGQHRPEARKYGPRISVACDFPADGNKIQKDLRTALEKAGLKLQGR